MPNLTTALPRRTGDIEEDYDRLYQWAVSITDELKSLLCNLDSGNVTEAASIKAQNIDASQAKIKDAQIASLTADKLTAGVIDTGEITVTGSKGGNTMTLTGDSIIFRDSGRNERIYIGSEKDDETGAYNVVFRLQNAGHTQGVYMDSTGRIYFTGDIETTQDCVIQGQLRVGIKDNPVNKGIAFYGKRFSVESVNDGYCGSILPYVIGASEEGSYIYAGICIDTNLYIANGDGNYYRVITEKDLQDALSRS